MVLEDVGFVNHTARRRVFTQRKTLVYACLVRVYFVYSDHSLFFVLFTIESHRRELVQPIGSAATGAHARCQLCLLAPRRLPACHGRRRWRGLHLGSDWIAYMIDILFEALRAFFLVIYKRITFFLNFLFGFMCWQLVNWERDFLKVKKCRHYILTIYSVSAWRHTAELCREALSRLCISVAHAT